MLQKLSIYFEKITRRSNKIEPLAKIHHAKNIISWWLQILYLIFQFYVQQISNNSFCIFNLIFNYVLAFQKISKRVPYFPVFVLRPYCQPSEAFSPMMLIMSPSINDILVSPSPSCEYTALTCSPDVGGGGGTTRPWGRVFAVNKCLFLNGISFLF